MKTHTLLTVAAAALALIAVPRVARACDPTCGDQAQEIGTLVGAGGVAATTLVAPLAGLAIDKWRGGKDSPVGAAFLLTPIAGVAGLVIGNKLYDNAQTDSDDTPDNAELYLVGLPVLLGVSATVLTYWLFPRDDGDEKPTSARARRARRSERRWLVAPVAYPSENGQTSLGLGLHMEW